MFRNLFGISLLIGLCVGGAIALQGKSTNAVAEPPGIETVPLTAETAIQQPARQQRAERPPRTSTREADRVRPAERRAVSANYEIYYFGSERCGYCARWMAGPYAEWRRDPARRAARLHLAPEVEAFAVNRGVRGENFGRYHRIYERAFRNRDFGFPAFVLTSNNEIVDVGTGARAWHRMAGKVRQEAQTRGRRR